MDFLKVLKRIATILLFFYAFNLSAQEGGIGGNCGNGIDDDGDGLIDCYDGQCSGTVNCDGFYFGNTTPGCQSTPDPGEPFTLTRIWDTDNIGYPMDQRQTVLVADIDQDGIPEVIGKNDNPGRIYIFNGEDGSLQTEIQMTRSTDIFNDAPAIADIDADGTAT